MKNKIIKIVVGILLLILLMYAEYRCIMLNARPYLGENNNVYIEVFGQIEEYCAENIEGYK